LGTVVAQLTNVTLLRTGLLQFGLVFTFCFFSQSLITLGHEDLGYFMELSAEQIYEFIAVDFADR
jgi:hypothetical protein